MINDPKEGITMKKAEIKESDNFFERLLKNYMNLKLGYQGSILFFGGYGKSGYYVLLFDDALWFAENFKLTVFDLHGVPFVHVPGNILEYYIQWAMLQTKNVKKQNRLQGSFVRELDKKTLH